MTEPLEPSAVVPEGWELVPKEPTEAILRPFYECPPDELNLAWQAALYIANRSASPAAPQVAGWRRMARVYLVPTPGYRETEEGTHRCTCGDYPHTPWCGPWSVLGDEANLHPNAAPLPEDYASAPPAREAEAPTLEDAYAEGRKDEQEELASVLPGMTYMDPPDGGAPTILEQLQRQAKDAARYLWLRNRKAYVAVHPHHRDLPKEQRTGWTIRMVSGNDESFDAAVDAAMWADGYAAPLPAPPALSRGGEAEAASVEDAIPVAVLRQHWLCAVECDHGSKRDKPHCACSQVDLGWHPSVGAAVEAWLTHIQEASASPVQKQKAAAVPVAIAALRRLLSALEGSSMTFPADTENTKGPEWIGAWHAAKAVIASSPPASSAPDEFGGLLQEIDRAASPSPSPAAATQQADKLHAAITDERILHLWDTHVAYESNPNRPKQPPLTDKDKVAFARAVLYDAALAATPASPAPAGDERVGAMLWLGSVRDEFRKIADDANRILSEHVSASLYATPATALKTAALRVLVASEKATRGCVVPRWAGQENGLGEEFGEELDAALCDLRAALSSPSGEGAEVDPDATLPPGSLVTYDADVLRAEVREGNGVKDRKP